MCYFSALINVPEGKIFLSLFGELFTREQVGTLGRKVESGDIEVHDKHFFFALLAVNDINALFIKYSSVWLLS